AFARYYREDRLPGLHFGVQSSVADPQTLLSRVDAFLEGFEAELAAMDPVAFEANRQALVTSLLEAPDGLYDRTGDLGRDLALGMTSFDRKSQIAVAIGTITREEIQDFYQQRVRGEDARRLVIRATGHAHAATVPAEPGVRSVEALVSALPGAFERSRP
ncbi:MAG: secreted Zn-dependent insulinase-like peptidase, partial [Myxococcota bacterium]